MDLPLQLTLPIGMVFNELLTNYFKGAFNEDSNDGKLVLKGYLESGIFVIQVADNGSGIGISKKKQALLCKL